MLNAVLAVVVASTSPSQSLAPAFGNVIVSTYPDGREAKVWLSPDGAYRGEGRSGRPSNGRWTVKPGKLCFRQVRPIPIPFSWCTPLVEGGVGTTWTARAVSGEPIRVQLRPGAG